jgi:hypothetical protein
MDDIVRQALAKWPQVPHCYGWLALDARGDYYMRDDRIRAAGPFPQVKGSCIRHDKLLAFIHRNSGCDAHGAWYFQNGPQRVYLELEATPLVARLRLERAAARLDCHAHLGWPLEPLTSWVDEQGRMFLDVALPAGAERPARTLALVHSQDMVDAADALEAGLLPPPQPLASGELAARGGFDPRPQPPSA